MEKSVQRRRNYSEFKYECTIFTINNVLLFTELYQRLCKVVEDILLSNSLLGVRIPILYVGKLDRDLPILNFSIISTFCVPKPTLI